MADIDLFANDLLEESKRFLERAAESSDPVAQASYLHACLMLSFCSLEAHINAMADEFSVQKSLSDHEKGLLLERDVRLEDGEFRVTKFLKIARLEDRIDFLHAKFSGVAPDRSASGWHGRLSDALSLRNQLTHAKTVPTITEAAVRSSTQAIVDALDALYRAIYKRPFPPSSRGLSSRLSF